MSLSLRRPHFKPSAGSSASCVDLSEESEDAEVDIETIGGGGVSIPLVPTTSSSPSSLVEDAGGGIGIGGVKDAPNTSGFSSSTNLAATSSPSSSSSSSSSHYASSIYVTAEILDGPHEGAFTDLHVTLPPLEDIAGVLSVMEDEADELDLAPTEDRGRKGSASSHSFGEVLATSLSCNNVTGPDGDSGSGAVTKTAGISGTKWTLTNNVVVCKAGNGSSNSSSGSISVSSSNINNNSSSVIRNNSSWYQQQQPQHSTTSSNLNFQTLPSSKFFTSDTTTCPPLVPLNSGGSRNPQQQQQPSSTSHLVTGDDSLKLGISPLSSCSPFSSSSFNYNSYNNINSNNNHTGTLLQQNQQSSLSSSTLSPSSTSSFSRSLVSVSSSLATSLNNSLFCASSNLPSTTTCISTATSTLKSIDDSSLQEQNSKKLPNISSLYFRQAKLDSLSSGILLSNNKNGNNLLNSNSNLVSQKILTWTNDTLSSEENSNAVITNGPSSKSLDNLKCAKVTPIVFPET